MKALLKYSGLIIQLIGVILLLVPKFMSATTNLTLGLGGFFIVLGVVAHIIVNRVIKE